MFQKIKDNLKKDWIYWIISLSLMFITLLIATVNYSKSGDYSVNTPFSSIYGLISYILIIVFGMFEIFIFRNANNDDVCLEKLFLWVVIPIGIIMCLATPLGKIPDEDDHAKKSMAMSYGNIFSVADENGKATDMLNAKLHELVSRTTDSYEDALRRINLSETEEEIELTYNTMALYAPICHAPQALGMFVARILGGGVTIQCYAARLLNFTVSIFLIYNAIKIMPYKKYLLLFISLLPVTFNLLPTMSADALTLSISLFYIAYILHLKYNKENYGKKEFITLIISTIVISLCKIVYLPLCLLLFVLPKEKFGTLKKKNIITITTIVFAIILNLIWLAYCSRFLIEFNPGVNSKEQVIYILTNPIEYCIILFRTMNFNHNIFITGLCGDGLGAYCVKASELFIYPCIVIITVLFFSNNEEQKIKFDLFTKLMFLFVFLSIVFLIYTSLYVQWTPLKNPMIIGVQARYFLPIILLTAIFLDNEKIIIKEKLNRILLSFLLFFNLNVITATIFTYYFGMLIDGYIK